VKLDKILHAGGPEAAHIAIESDMVLFAREHGFSAEKSVREHVEAGLIPKV
jgi:hypothetical protein